MTLVSMKNHEHYSGYQLEVLNRLYQRNKNERKPYEDIILLNNKQYAYLDQLRIENSKLLVSNDKLQINGEPGSFKSEKMNALKRRHSVLQDELAEMHRQNREYAQQVIQLRAALDEKEKEIARRKTENQQLKESLIATEGLLKEVQHKLAVIEEPSSYSEQIIEDDNASLQSTFANAEPKIQYLEKATCLSELKEDADAFKTEQEELQSKKEAELQIGLEVVGVDTNKINGIVHLDAILSRKGRYKFIAHESEVNAVAWTHSGCKFATAGDDHKVRMWNFDSGEVYFDGVANGSNSSIYSLDFNIEDRLILTASCDGACRIWTTNDLKIQDTLTGHDKKVMSAKFLGESGKVVSGSYDRTLRIWDLQRRSCIRSICAGSSVNDVVTNYWHGINIVSGHMDKKIRFWDERCDYCIHKISLQERITSIDLSSDGYSLLSSDRDDTLQLIDIRMYEVVRSFRSIGFIIGSDWARAKFSPDGEFCVCGSMNGSIFIWEVSTGVLKAVLKEHRSTVMSCAWSMCGRYLLSCDKDKYAILWLKF